LNKGFMSLMLGVVVAGLGLGALLASKTAPPATPVVQASGQINAGGGSRAGGASGAADPSAQGQAGQGSAMPVGTVSAKEGDTATVKTQQGDLKVKLTGVRVQKTMDGTSDDLKPGTSVVVMGQQSGDGTVAATSIQIRPADATAANGGQGRANQGGGQGQQAQGQQGQGQRQAQGQAQGQGARPMTGTVSAISGDAMTISGQQGDTKVSITGAKIQKTVDGSADDVTVGQSVALVGQAGSDGSFAATMIQIRPAAGSGSQPAAGSAAQATPAAPQATPVAPAKSN
jgi:hypothetical protein